MQPTMSYTTTPAAKPKRRTYPANSAFGRADRSGPASTSVVTASVPPLTEDQKQEIKEAFDLFDGNSDGFLDYHELKVAMRALGFDVSKAEVLAILQQHDPNQPQFISFPSFSDVSTYGTLVLLLAKIVVEKGEL